MIRGPGPLATLVLVFAALLGCVSTNEHQDFTLSLGASGLPGLGGNVGIAQRMWDGRGLHADFEMDLTRQAIDDTPEADEGDWDQVRAGVKFTPERQPTEGAGFWSVRAGVVWLRSRGDPVYLDDSSDYGGVYLGLGWEFRLSRHFTMGPDLVVHYVDAEGTGDSGAVPQIAWRIYWHF